MQSQSRNESHVVTQLKRTHSAAIQSDRLTDDLSQTLASVVLLEALSQTASSYTAWAFETSPQNGTHKTSRAA